ncbi:hypothetical protein [Streptomyces griseocarneus]|uniref:hypothetical protein n=1 Tax=Streptomyces griseocarneus TaxID=51201 RepID=UPI00167C675D|nr:hypothetical protein [Streptomyces griseocarneus]MBZ6475084.1 hypothetical protein [Streptomyces griseocarneus]GHG62337.1 hypothetical protein GCM10018779_30960 [Streptomyces griseocarneus]
MILLPEVAAQDGLGESGMSETSRQPVAIERSLVLGEVKSSSGVSIATAQLSGAGDLVLYCTDSGYAVMMQIGEHVREHRRWHTVAAEDVSRLVDDPATVLEAVRDAVVTKDENSEAHGSPEIEARFVQWLRSREVPFTSQSEDYEG